MNDVQYSLQELADAAGVSPRTVRYYIAEGLLPPPEPAGHKTSYSADHLNRLELIGLLKEAYLPLKEIRSRLAGIRNEDLGRALAEAGRVRNPARFPDLGEDRAIHESRESQRHLRSPMSTEDEPETVAHGHPEDAVAYIDRVLGNRRHGSRRPAPRPPAAPRQEQVWRRLPIGSTGEAEIVVSDDLYRRRKDRIDALLVWAEKMLEQD